MGAVDRLLCLRLVRGMESDRRMGLHPRRRFPVCRGTGGGRGTGGSPGCGFRGGGRADHPHNRHDEENAAEQEDRQRQELIHGEALEGVKPHEGPAGQVPQETQRRFVQATDEKERDQEGHDARLLLHGRSPPGQCGMWNVKSGMMVCCARLNSVGNGQCAMGPGRGAGQQSWAPTGTSSETIMR